MVPALEQEIRDLQALVGSSRDPEGRAFVPLADAYRRAGDPDRAAHVVAEGLTRHPGMSSGHLVSAWIQLDLGNAEEAEAAFRRVLEMDGGNAAALAGLDSLLARNEDPLSQERAPDVASADTEPEVDEGVVDVSELAPDSPPESSPPPVELHGVGIGAEGDLVIEWDVESIDPASSSEQEEPWPVEAVAPEATPEDVVDPWSGSPLEEAPEVGARAVEPGEVSGQDEIGGPDEAVADDEPILEVPSAEDGESLERDSALGARWEGAEAEWFASVAEWVEAEVVDPDGRDAVPEADEADDLLMELAELAPDVEPGVPLESETHEDEPALPTRTLAELYARQGLVAEAVSVLESLVARRPDDADLRARLEELLGDAAAPHEEAVEAPVEEASPRAAQEESGPTVSEFMDRLLAWRRPVSGDE